MVRKLGLVPARQFTARNFFGYPFRRTSLEDAATLIAVAAAVGLIAWFAARAWRTKPDDPSAPLRLGALTSACLFASPHLIEYDLGMHAVGFLAGCAHLLSGRALHRRIGAVTTVAFFLSPFLHPLSKELHFGLGAAVLLAWLLWLGAEVRGLGGAQAAGSTA